MPRRNIDDEIRRYDQAKQLKLPFEPDFRLSAAYCLPRHYSAWQSTEMPAHMGDKQAAKRFAYDATAANSLPKWVAILQRLATPSSQMWANLTASNDQLMRVRRVREYFQSMTQILHKARYHPRAGFIRASTETYSQIGAYGGGPYRLGWRNRRAEDRSGGFGFRALHMRDIFVLWDNDGNIDTVYYRLWMTARQFKMEFPGVTPPRSIANELAKANGPSETEFFEIVHVVQPRSLDEYDPQSITQTRHPYTSSWICVKDKEYIGEESGYRTQPYIFPTLYSEPGNWYGYGPAMRALAAMGGVSAQKKSMIRAGQKMADPVLIARDDGVLSGKVGLIPGHVNWGGIDANGRRMLDTLNQHPSSMNFPRELLEDDRKDIQDAFLVSLFEIAMQESLPQMTTTQVIERIAEKGALAAPVMGMMQAEMLGPNIEREISLMVEYQPHRLPEMPPELIEAEGEFEVIYTSPLAKSLYAENDAGFLRLLEYAINYAQSTGDKKPLYYFKLDTALPEIADHQAVPAHWISTEDEVKAAVEADAEQVQTEQLIKAGPALASVAKDTMRPDKRLQ